MKELEKTKRVSFSAIIIILLVLIGIFTFKKPENSFKKDINLTLKPTIEKSFVVKIASLDTIKNDNYIFIDLRNAFEFNKGHIKNAKNIYTPDLLDIENKEFIKDQLKANKTVVLYSENAKEASGPWLLLTQMGYKNLKVLCAKTSYINKEFKIEDYPLEKNAYNFAEFIKKASNSKNRGEVKKAKKRIIKLTKKKKKVAEGGC